MDSDAEIILERAVVHDFVYTLRQSWLRGYDLALAMWQTASAMHSNALPEMLLPETLHVQLLTIAMKLKRDPAEYLRQLIASKLPETVGGWREGLCWSPTANSPKAIWYEALMGLISAPNWRLIADAWSSMTPAFVQMGHRVTGKHNVVPEAMTVPASFAWLDRETERTMIPEKTVKET